MIIQPVNPIVPRLCEDPGKSWTSMPLTNSWERANAQLTRLQQNLWHYRYNRDGDSHFLREPYDAKMVRDWLEEAVMWRKLINQLGGM